MKLNKTGKIVVIIGILLTIVTLQAKTKWIKYTDEEGNFSILFPGTPKTQVQDIDTEAGVIKGYMFSANIDEQSLSFLLMYSDFPEELIGDSDVMSILESTVMGQTQGVNGTIEKKQEITLQDKYQGLEAQYSSNTLTFKTHVFLIENRLFQILTAVEDIDKKKEKSIDKFLNSFEINE